MSALLPDVQTPLDRTRAEPLHHYARDLSILGAVTVLAAVVRFVLLDQKSLWADEYASLVVARYSLADVPTAALAGAAFEPPLYFLLLHGIVCLFGDGETALRLLSALAGTLTIPAICFLLRELEWRAPRAALAALVLAGNPLHLWYSQEARPYALMVLFGTLALASLAAALRRRGAAGWIGFAAFSAAAILTHATAIVVPVIGAAWAWLANGRAAVPRLAGAAAGIAAAVAPFAVILARSAAAGEGTGSPPRSLTGLEVPYTFFTYVAGYSFGPPVRAVQDLGSLGAVLEHPVQAAIAGGMLAAIAASAIRLRGQRALALVLLCVAPAAAAFSGSLVTGKAYNVRYAVFGLIGFVALTVAAAAAAKPGLGRWTLGLLLAVSLWADAQWFVSPRYWKDDSRAAVACLQARLPAGSAVAVAPRYMEPVLAHYSRRSGAALRFVGIDDERGVAGPNPPAALLITRRHHVSSATAIADSFARSGGTRQSVQVTGYRIYLRPAVADDHSGSCEERS